MAYFKGFLSFIAALFLAEFVPWPWFRGISQEKATGLAAVAGGFAESLFSPLFWVVVILFFGLFFAAGRLGNKILRILLFWLPTITLSTLTLTMLALFVFVFIRFRRS